jgi:hypothetical protein
MKVITLTQPWATLVAIGAKKIETRSWETLYRGPLAIHAAKGLGPGGKRAFYDQCYRQPFLAALEPAMTGEREIAGVSIPHVDPARLPLGAIVAVCELLGCEWIGYEWPDDQQVMYTGKWGRAYAGHRLTDQERAFGDYTPGRFVWLLSNVRALPEPVPCKGALGLWNYEGQL